MRHGGSLHHRLDPGECGGADPVRVEGLLPRNKDVPISSWPSVCALQESKGVLR